MIARCASYRERVHAPGPKRMLAIDGGGIRGLISIEILAKLQQLLREAYDDEKLVLADYFDYVAGTSTGAIIASGICVGMSIEEIRTFYEQGAAVMLKPAPIFQRFLHRLRATGITRKLQEELGDTRLGDPGLDGLAPLGERNARALKTLLLLVVYRCDTDSPWPLSNNPQAKYNQKSEAEGNNLYLHLWQLVRASSAAPTYFPPEEIYIRGKKSIFADGAVTPYNNPAYLLYIMATLDRYRLCWPRGEDRLLLVSVGTGSIANADPKLRSDQMNLLYNATRIPSALIYAATVEADKLCRIAGRCTFGAEIDREIGTLVDEGPGADPRPRDFTYVRYDPDLSESGLTALGLFPTIAPGDVLPLISGKHVKELQTVGRAYAEKIRLEHFGAFNPALVRA